MYGVPYEVFWHLNPRKLEPFREKKALEEKEKVRMLDRLAWLIGSYSIDAMGVWWGKNSKSYPEQPRSFSNSLEHALGEGKGEVMSDGARFAAFAMAHNKQIKERRKK